MSARVQHHRDRRQAILPMGLFVAQLRAQTAEQKAESAFSHVGVIADQTRHAQSIAEAAIAEARSVHNEVSSKIAAFTKRADDSTSSTIGMLPRKMEEVTAQTEAQTSRVVAQVTQQLERELEAVATSMAMTSEQKTRVAVEDVCSSVQAQFD